MLSTLLLSSSPRTATALLHALAQAARAAEAGVPAAPVPFPRRSEEKVSARGEHPLTLRLDMEPDLDSSLVLSARGIVLVPDDAPAPPPAASHAAFSRPVAATPSRAPPA